jgi:hypothetical protein
MHIMSPLGFHVLCGDGDVRQRSVTKNTESYKVLVSNSAFKSAARYCLQVYE